MFENDKLLMTLSRRAMREGNTAIRLTTVDENTKWLTEIVQLLRKFNPNLRIVFTLSPVPLAASFIHESVIASDCLSKSTLRLALANVMSQGIPGTHYWPAFEIVRWLSGHTMPMFGTEDGVPRHVSTSVVQMIVNLFLKYYVV